MKEIPSAQSLPAWDKVTLVQLVTDVQLDSDAADRLRCR